jgi:murein DD-endopeptidase MepM/ murein hydrolase activator NlpD
MIQHRIVTFMVSWLFFAAHSSVALEVRTCDPPLRAAPLNEQRDMQSLLLQAITVFNGGAEPEKLESLSFELLSRGAVVDSRELSTAKIVGAISAGKQFAALGQLLPGVMCNGKLLEQAKLAKSDVLAPGEALVFAHEFFAWNGARDTLRIVAKGSRTATASMPITTSAADTAALFPIAGRTYVAAGFTPHSHHRWVAIEEFSYDIARVAEGGVTYRGTGSKMTDYLVYGAPVRAVAAGKVIAAHGDDPDNVAMLKKPDEDDSAYLKRLQAAQGTLIARGAAGILGNHVVLDHGNGEFSIYAHLKPDSVRVKPGESVAAGQTIAAAGSSGNSTEPHLHFQMCDGPSVDTCRPKPANFAGIRLPLELGPRAVQSGDIVETVL